MSHRGEGSVSHAIFVAVLCSVVSDSLRPRALQPTRLLHPWDSSRQEYWSGLPFPSPGDLSDPGIEPMSSALLSEPPEKPLGKEENIFIDLSFNF